MRPIDGERPDGSQYRYNDKKAEAARKVIAQEAKIAFMGKRPATGPVIVRVVAIFGIPPSWPPKLRAAALEARVMHIADPDLDQIVKLVKDALKGIAYVDDNQVCGYPNSAKRYGQPERTEVTVTALPQLEDERTPGQRRLEGRIRKEGWDAVLAPPAKSKKRSNTSSPDGDQARAVRVSRTGGPPRRGKPLWRRKARK